MPPELIAELTTFSIFIWWIVFTLLKKQKSYEILTFVIPYFLYDLFMEAMGAYSLRFSFSEKGHLYILGVPVAVSLGLVLIVYCIFSITDKITARLKIEPQTYLASIIDGLLAVLVALIIDPIAQKLSLWTFPDDGFYFGIPFLNFIGWFFVIFIFSLGYRTFKKYEFKKRFVFTYCYIFSVLLIKFIFDTLFIWK